MNKQKEKIITAIKDFILSHPYKINQTEDFLYSPRRMIYKKCFKSQTSPYLMINFYDSFDLNSFNIAFWSQKIVKTKIVSQSFWGKEKISFQEELKSTRYICYPFLSEYNKEELDVFDPISNNYIEFYKVINLLSNSENNLVTAIESNKFVYDLVLFIEKIVIDYNDSLSSMESSIQKTISQLDSDNNGIVDVTEGIDSLMKMLNKHQSKIIEIDKNYILKFIKLSNYIKNKKDNIQTIFENINKSDSVLNKEELLGILKNQINSLNLITFHSLSMIVSLVDGNLISFYEIYESFDKLNVFNSNWENEVKEELVNIGSELGDLMYNIQEMEEKVVSAIGNLTYITQSSFKNLETSVSNELRPVFSVATP